MISACTYHTICISVFVFGDLVMFEKNETSVNLFG